MPQHYNRESLKAAKDTNTKRLVSAAQFLSPGPDGLSQSLQGSLGVFPVDASICDADTVLEAGLALGRDLLVAYNHLSQYVCKRRRIRLLIVAHPR